MEYDKLEERGRGAFAKVYRAKETITGRVLAIKTYQTGRGVRNESQIIEAAREGVSMSISQRVSLIIFPREIS